MWSLCKKKTNKILALNAGKHLSQSFSNNELDWIIKDSKIGPFMDLYGQKKSTFGPKSKEMGPFRETSE